MLHKGDYKNIETGKLRGEEKHFSWGGSLFPWLPSAWAQTEKRVWRGGG